MIQAWMVYRGFEIEKVDEAQWRVLKNREQQFVAQTPGEARAWIDGKLDRNTDKARAYARKRR